MTQFVNHAIFFWATTKIGQRRGASWWRVCYQRGLPRLVLPSNEASSVIYTTKQMRLT